MAAQEWWYAEGGSSKGPVALPTLLGMVSEGVLSGDTLVWREGLEGWEPVSRFAPNLASVPTVARRRFPLPLLIGLGLLAIVAFAVLLPKGVQEDPILPPVDLLATPLAEELVLSGIVPDAAPVLDRRLPNDDAQSIVAILLARGEGERPVEAATITVAASLQAAERLAESPGEGVVAVRCAFTVVTHRAAPEEAEVWTALTSQTGAGMATVVAEVLEDWDCSEPEAIPSPVGGL